MRIFAKILVMFTLVELTKGPSEETVDSCETIVVLRFHIAAQSSLCFFLALNITATRRAKEWEPISRVCYDATSRRHC